MLHCPGQPSRALSLYSTELSLLDRHLGIRFPVLDLSVCFLLGFRFRLTALCKEHLGGIDTALIGYGVIVTCKEIKVSYCALLLW